jgi:uncharacterized protein
MQRSLSESLQRWLSDEGRRPLVLRGARQVGKTWLVRDLASSQGRELVELNFERDPHLARHFASNDPATILGELSLRLGRDIEPQRCLLFLDEIQAAGDVLAKLRWFYEELPALPVIAAGSLLEFTLADHAFSMPVGRVTFRHVEPMSFVEYLQAHGQQRLLDAVAPWRPGRTISPAAHEMGGEWFHRYSMVGGMPAVVAADVQGRQPRHCRELQRDLVATYRADFAKYSGRMDRTILDTVLSSIAASIGAKFVYSRAGQGVKHHQSKRALELLAAARLCQLVRHSAADGPPLGATVKGNRRKAILLDVGLLHALVGTPATTTFPSWEALAPSLRGRLSDQLAGQQLRLIDDGVADLPELYYWQREGGRSGEIDYLIQLQGRVLPLEIKAGAAGAMKSLHQFMFDKQLGLALRCDANPPSEMRVAVKTTQGDSVDYRLVSVPLYLLWNLRFVLEDLT